MKNLLQNLNKRSGSESGTALLTVLVAMAIISLLLFEFQYRTMVERKLASNELDMLKAYYLAKSGIRIGLLRIGLYGRAKASPAIKSISKTVNINPYLEFIWNLPLPPFPPDQESLKQLGTKDRNDAIETLKQTRVEDAIFTHVISSESSKINLNFLQIQKKPGQEDVRIEPPDFNQDPKSLHEYVAKTLFNLISGFIRDSEDPYEEFGNMRPEDIVFNIMDWVNPGSEGILGGAKDNWYEKQDPPYQAKKHRLFTIDELKLVRGVDDALFRRLKPHITVYSYGGKLNINLIRKALFLALYPDFTEDDLKQLLEERDRIQGWPSEKAFVDWVSDELGRGGFRDYFNDPTTYPFSVGSESFLIVSLGQVKKSASSVQRSIQVAVALVSESRGGKTIPGITQAKDCTGNDRFFHTRASKCMYRPTNQKECLGVPGDWQKAQGEKWCCIILQVGTICPGGASGGKGAGGKPPEAVPPNAMKILNWSEA